MTREGFIAALRGGLQGLPQSAIEEIVSDYDAHFAEGLSAGRSDSDVSSALGDPHRLARELRAEAGLKRWETERNPSAAAGAVIALIGLGALDIMFLVPFLLAVICILFACFIGMIVAFFIGGAVFVSGPFAGGAGSPVGQVLFGLGVMAISTSGVAVLSILSIGVTNAVVWFARLHYRLLKPAMGEGAS